MKQLQGDQSGAGEAAKAYATEVFGEYDPEQQSEYDHFFNHLIEFSKRLQQNESHKGKSDKCPEINHDPVTIHEIPYDEIYYNGKALSELLQEELGKVKKIVNNTFALDEYIGWKNEPERAVKSLLPFAVMFNELTDIKLRQGGIVFQFNSAEITVDDLRNAHEVVSSFNTASPSPQTSGAVWEERDVKNIINMVCDQFNAGFAGRDEFVIRTIEEYKKRPESASSNWGDETKRLKGLLQILVRKFYDLYDYKHCKTQEEYWQDFKTENNI